MKPTDKEFGTRAEIKNLNSLKSITRAIEYEIKRQSQLLDSGGRVVQETRRFNDNRGETKPLRSKENAHDYRYFPDPDIAQVNLSNEMLDEIKAKLPELPEVRFERYTKEFGLSDIDAKNIIQSKKICDFFNEAILEYNNPKSVASFILTELLRRINLGEIDVENIQFSAKDFAKLVEMSDTEKVSKNDAKTIFRYMAEAGGSPVEIAKEHGFLIEIDMSKVDSTINEVFAANENTVAQYLAGEEKVFGFLMGQCSKQLKGIATPKVIKDALEAKLASMK